MSSLLPFALFIPISLFTFTIPGISLLLASKHKFSWPEYFFIGTTIGFVVFTLISYLLTILDLQVLLLPLYIFISLKYSKPAFKIIRSVNINSLNGVIILVFILGIAGQLAIIAPSGMQYGDNILFWSSHGHDGMWHVALMEEIRKGWPFQNPVFAGERLVNYHFFSDVAPAMFSKYLPFSDLDLYFRFFPLLYSVLLGTSAYILTKRMTNNTSASIWATFFTYFAGSFGFIVTYLKDKSFGGESIFWATQIQSSSGNPPQIISNFLVLTVLFLLLLLTLKKDKILFLITIIFLSTMALFKVYAAIVVLGPVTLIGLWLVIRKKEIYMLSLSIISGILAAILYLPNVQASTSFLIFQPWWYIRTMIVEPSRLNWIDHELRRQTYIAENNWKRVIYLESIGFLIFLFGNLGMRFLGLIEFVKLGRESLKKYFNLLIILITIISFVLPLLFLQKGVATNTSQFLQYFILLFGIFAGISSAKLLSSIKLLPLRLILIIFIIALSIPTQLGFLKELYFRTPFAKISRGEAEALNFIKNNTPSSSVILTQPYDTSLDLGEKTPRIWDWYDTAYVSALSGRREYFADREQVDIMGYSFEDREKNQRDFFESKDINFDKISLAKNFSGVKYLYFPTMLKPKADLVKVGLTKIFENDEAEVWMIPN